MYTPAKTKLYEYFVRQTFINAYPDFKTIMTRCKITILAYFEIPKNTSKKNIEKMLNNEISPTKKPDIDNITKIILDAMNKFAYKDDTYITKLVVEKFYSKVPKVYVRIEEY